MAHGSRGGNSRQRKKQTAAKGNFPETITAATTTHAREPKKDPQALTFREKLKSLNAQGYLWGGVGVIGTSLIVSTVGRLGGLIVGFVLVSLACWHISFFRKGWPYWVGNSVVTLIIGASLFLAYRLVPTESYAANLDAYFAKWGTKTEHQMDVIKMKDLYHQLGSIKIVRAQLFMDWCLSRDDEVQAHYQEWWVFQQPISMSSRLLLSQRFSDAAKIKHDKTETNRQSLATQDGQLHSVLADIRVTFPDSRELDDLANIVTMGHACAPHVIDRDITMQTLSEWEKRQDAKNGAIVNVFYIQPIDMLLAHLKTDIDRMPSKP